MKNNAQVSGTYLLNGEYVFWLLKDTYLINNYHFSFKYMYLFCFNELGRSVIERIVWNQILWLEDEKLAVKHE